MLVSERWFELCLEMSRDSTWMQFVLTIGSFLLNAEFYYLQLCLGVFCLLAIGFLLTIEVVLLKIEACFAFFCILLDCEQRSSIVSKKLQL